MRFAGTGAFFFQVPRPPRQRQQLMHVLFAGRCVVCSSCMLILGSATTGQNVKTEPHKCSQRVRAGVIRPISPHRVAQKTHFCATAAPAVLCIADVSLGPESAPQFPKPILPNIATICQPSLCLRNLVILSGLVALLWNQRVKNRGPHPTISQKETHVANEWL